MNNFQLPMMERIRETVETGRVLVGKEKEAVLRWCRPRATKALAKKSDRAAIKKDPVRRALKEIETGRKQALEKADTAFALFIRKRDTRPLGESRVGNCVTCGRLLDYASLQCGHWIVRSKWGTRFRSSNSHAQCKACNNPAQGNGRVNDHENAIMRLHGIDEPKMLLVFKKLNQRRPSNKALLEVAAVFTAKTEALP